MARVLLVDDDRTLCEVLGRTLEREGFRCEMAGDGRTGLTRLCEATVAADPFDCILLDIAMPEVNGWEVLKAIKCNPLWADTRVIVLTGMAITASDIAKASSWDALHVPKNGRFIELIAEMLSRMTSPAL